MEVPFVRQQVLAFNPPAGCRTGVIYKKIGRIDRCFALNLRITTKALLVGRGVVVGGNELRVIVWNQFTN